MVYQNDFSTHGTEEKPIDIHEAWEEQPITVPLKAWESLKERVIYLEWGKDTAEKNWAAETRKRINLEERLKQLEGGE